MIGLRSRAALIWAVLLLASSAFAAPSCLTTFNSGNGVWCYWQSKSLPIATFSDAEAECASTSGGHLWSISSRTEQFQVARFLETDAADTNLMLALKLDGSTWRWLDGTYASVTPLPGAGSCAAVNIFSNVWSTVDCSSPRRYVCKRALALAESWQPLRSVSITNCSGLQGDSVNLNSNVNLAIGTNDGCPTFGIVRFSFAAVADRIDTPGISMSLLFRLGPTTDVAPKEGTVLLQSGGTTPWSETNVTRRMLVDGGLLSNPQQLLVVGSFKFDQMVQWDMIRVPLETDKILAHRLAGRDEFNLLLQSSDAASSFTIKRGEDLPPTLVISTPARARPPAVVLSHDYSLIRSYKVAGEVCETRLGAYRGVLNGTLFNRLSSLSVAVGADLGVKRIDYCTRQRSSSAEWLPEVAPVCEVLVGVGSKNAAFTPRGLELGPGDYLSSSLFGNMTGAVSFASANALGGASFGLGANSTSVESPLLSLHSPAVAAVAAAAAFVPETCSDSKYTTFNWSLAGGCGSDIAVLRSRSPSDCRKLCCSMAACRGFTQAVSADSGLVNCWLKSSFPFGCRSVVRNVVTVIKPFETAWPPASNARDVLLLDDYLPDGVTAKTIATPSNSEGEFSWSTEQVRSRVQAHKTTAASGAYFKNRFSFDTALPLFSFPSAGVLSVFVYLHELQTPSLIMLEVDSTPRTQPPVPATRRAFWSTLSPIDTGATSAGLILPAVDAANVSLDAICMGPLPPLGGWYRLSVSTVALALSTLGAVHFVSYGGIAHWDYFTFTPDTGVALKPMPDEVDGVRSCLGDWIDSAVPSVKTVNAANGLVFAFDEAAGAAAAYSSTTSVSGRLVSSTFTSSGYTGGGVSIGGRGRVEVAYTVALNAPAPFTVSLRVRLSSPCTEPAGCAIISSYGCKAAVGVKRASADSADAAWESVSPASFDVCCSKCLASSTCTGANYDSSSASCQLLSGVVTMAASPLSTASITSCAVSELKGVGGYEMWMDGEGLWLRYATRGSLDKSLFRPFSFAVDSWYLVAASFGADGSVALSVDGAVVASSAPTSDAALRFIPNRGSSLSIGASLTRSGFTGFVDDFSYLAAEKNCRVTVPWALKSSTGWLGRCAPTQGWSLSDSGFWTPAGESQIVLDLLAVRDVRSIATVGANESSTCVPGGRSWLSEFSIEYSLTYSLTESAFTLWETPLSSDPDYVVEHPVNFTARYLRLSTARMHVPVTGMQVALRLEAYVCDNCSFNNGGCLSSVSCSFVAGNLICGMCPLGVSSRPGALCSPPPPRVPASPPPPPPPPAGIPAPGPDTTGPDVEPPAPAPASSGETTSPAFVDSPASSASSALSTGALIGIIVGGVLLCLIVLVVIIGLLLMRRRKSKRPPKAYDVADTHPTQEMSVTPSSQVYQSTPASANPYASVPVGGPALAAGAVVYGSLSAQSATSSKTPPVEYGSFEGDANRSSVTPTKTPPVEYGSFEGGVNRSSSSVSAQSPLYDSMPSGPQDAALRPAGSVHYVPMSTSSAPGDSTYSAARPVSAPHYVPITGTLR